jgi:hypothetical protein
MPGDSERALGGLSAAGKVDERDLQTSGRSQSLTGAVLCTIMCDVATRACSSADRAADFESDGRGFESLQARLVQDIAVHGIKHHATSSRVEGAATTQWPTQ